MHSVTSKRTVRTAVHRTRRGKDGSLVEEKKIIRYHEDAGPRAKVGSGLWLGQGCGLQLQG